MAEEPFPTPISRRALLQGGAIAGPARAVDGRNLR